jgi:hypothetical protein
VKVMLQDRWNGDSTSDYAKGAGQLKSQLIEKPLIALPPLAGLIATALFLLQGGFGGGHGRFDGLNLASVRDRLSSSKTASDRDQC